MIARVVVNRRARHLASRGPLLAELSRSRHGIEIIETNSLDELDSFARAEVSRARDVSRPRDASKSAATDDAPSDVLVLAGGDGSYMAGVSALVRAFAHDEASTSRPLTLPAIALAPGGTVGTVARNWSHARGSNVRRAARLLDAIASGAFTTTGRATLRVERTGCPTQIGFIFGAGLVARFFEVYEARGASGNLTAARIVARVFAGSFIGARFARSVLEPTPCVVSVDGARAPFDRVSLLAASVVADLGLGMRLLYRAGEGHSGSGPGNRFHVVATPLGARALGPQMPLVLAGRPLLGPRVDTLAARLSLRFPSGRGAYVLDGDLFHADAIEVSAGPTLDIVTL